MRLKTIQTLLFAYCLVVLTSCVDKATKFYNSGIAKFESEEYDLAAEDLQQAVQFGAPKKTAFYTIAESYRLSNRLHEAEQYYQKAIASGNRKENAKFYYALAMKSNGNYLGAKSQLQKYLQYGANNKLRKRAQKEIDAIDVIMEIGFRKDFYKVENFKEINTDAIEYSPFFYDDRTMYFTSSRGEGPIYPGQGTRFTDLFEYKFDGSTSRSGIARKLPELINEPRRHESSATFDQTGMVMIFSRSGNGKRNDYIKEVDLFESKLVAGEWSAPVRLAISDENSWDSNPFLTQDGKTLYFSSNREGGMGSNDIWKSEKQADNTWGEPINLGEGINTESEELFPYISKEGVFYFSSSGHPGFGQLDIFKVIEGVNGEKIAINPGKPLNSSYDDFGIVLRNETSGYFTSNRPDGMGDDDIYVFEYDINISYWLEGITQGQVIKNDQITDELEILPMTAVQLLDTKGNYLEQTISDQKGQFKFKVQPEKQYVLRANKDSYHTNTKNLSTVGMTKTKSEIEALGNNEVVLKDSIALEPFVKDMVIEFPPIYYEYDKWDIVQRSETILDDMAATLQEHPSILVELGSHTDARGTLKYNDILSQKRAESAVKYILDKGISSARLTAKGYGERVPKTLSKDTSYFQAGTELTHLYLDSLEKVNKDMSELGHQLNRRTEFKIVGFIEKPIGDGEIDVIDNGEKEEIYDEKLHQNEDAIIERNLINK